MSITAEMGAISAVEGVAFSGKVALFTTNDPGPPLPSAFSTTIDWGDGITSNGQVVSDGNGAYHVNGSHVYAEEQDDSLTASVSISDTAGSSTQVSGDADVFDAPLTIKALSFAATEGVAFSGDVATFTDANPAASFKDFRAAIDWGDGTTSRGIVTPAAGGVFHVSGSHVYTDEGHFPALVTVSDHDSFATTGFGNTTPLVSDIPGLAFLTDPNLVNAWGISKSAASPFWTADNGTGLSTLYIVNSVQTAPVTRNPLVVTIPPSTGSTASGTPTGTVANSNTSEFLLAPGLSSAFLFDTEDGTISGWNPRVPGGATNAILKVDNSQMVYPNGGVGAVYKGLALAKNGASDFLYAANFRSGNVDVFNNAFQPAGSFTDPSLTAQGYAPFGIQTIGSNIYVTFAKQDDTKHDDVAGPGNGYVDLFSPAGVMLGRLASNGPLNSPWGIALAPSSFGAFGGDLLVGNFGDGRINVFNPDTHAFLGQLTAAGASSPISINGLWALTFGNGGNGGLTNTLYFAAGFNDESDGLFGSISPGPQIAQAANVAEGDSLSSFPTPILFPTSLRTIHGTVGVFLDTDQVTPASDFIATIDWGDGTTSDGTVGGGHGVFTVAGSHTYRKSGFYTVTTTLRDDAPGTAQATSTSTALVLSVFPTPGQGQPTPPTVIGGGPPAGNGFTTTTVVQNVKTSSVVSPPATTVPSLPAQAVDAPKFLIH